MRRLFWHFARSGAPSLHTPLIARYSGTVYHPITYGGETNMWRKLALLIVAASALVLTAIGGQALAVGDQPYVDVPPKPGEPRHPAEMEKNRVLCQGNDALACRSYGDAILINALAGRLTKAMADAKVEAMIAQAMVVKAKACDLKAENVCSELGFAYQYGHSVTIDKGAAHRYFVKACAIDQSYCKNRDELAAFAGAAPPTPAGGTCQKIYADAFTLARGESDADRMFERQRTELEAMQRTKGAAANKEAARYNRSYNDHLYNKCKAMVQYSEQSRLAKCEVAQTTAIINYAKKSREQMIKEPMTACDYDLGKISVFY